MRDALRKLQKDREARERDARQLARTAAREREADDDDDERERTWPVLEAWEKGDILEVDASDCDLTKPKPAGGWPVKCKVADTTDPALLALQRVVDIKKILQAGRKAMRTLRKPASSVTHADRTETWGMSAVGYVIGCEDDGTPAKCVAIQKTLYGLSKRGGSYAGSMELHCGIMGTLGMDNCYVIPMAVVEHEDRRLGEGSLYGAMVHAVGFTYVGQCVMAGAPDAWAPGPLATVLADPKHDLHEYAVKGVAPPLMAPLSREEFSELTKEGMDNMSPAARKRMNDASKKNRQKTGVYVPGKENRNYSTEADVLAEKCGFRIFLFLAEALECIQHKRKPASWAAGKLTSAVLKRVGEAGLADKSFGPCFVTTLSEEKEKGRQLFCIEGFGFTKPPGTIGAPHVWDWIVETQRGPFPVYDVTVALGIFRANEPPPKLPWRAGVLSAPFAVKELIERALEWSPPAPQPSPRPAKKPRSAPPRRSGRLNK